ncbi:rho GTPase-activating protein 30 [Anolis carolinensis]|uniref:rho GTPase-activating protein 30 n=1 Tax=Anolis carolinensis TaxID=28377 RepID=UPI002F2B491F
MSLAMKARQKVKRKAAAKDRVFGCDLVEHLQSTGHDVPQVLKSCTEFVEQHGVVDGIYRLSGVSSNIQKLRLEFDTDRTPDLNKDVYLQDIHCVSSLCKAYFRELPNPLLTYQLYDKFAEAVAIQLEEGRLEKIKEVLKELPPPHYRTLEFLMKHLVHMASFSPQTNMHVRNLAIVWAPNLLRSKDIETSGFNGTAAFMEVRIQSIVVEFILTHVEQIFGDAPLRGGTRESLRKSLLLMGPSLNLVDEKCCFSYNVPTMLNQGDGPPQMRPYHTIIELNDSKRKGSLKGKKWKSIFNLGRYSQDAKRKFVKTEDKDYKSGKLRLRPAKSMDSLSSVPCTGDDEADLGRKKSQKKLLTLGRESFDGPASLDIGLLSSGECPEKAKAEMAVASKSEEEGGESAAAKSEPTTPKAGRSSLVGSSSPGRSPKSGRNRAEKCLGVHISGPLSVTVPFHITSNLTLSRLTRGLECPALSHCAAATEEEQQVSSQEGSSKDTEDRMTTVTAADENEPATETGDSEENRMSLEVQDSFSFLDSQEAWLEDPQKSPFRGPVNTADHGLDLGPLVEDDMGSGIMNQIIGGGMQLEMFSSLPPLNYLSIEECMNEHSDEEDDQYYLAMSCPDGKEADPEEVYLSAFDDLSPLANAAERSDGRRDEEDRSSGLTGGPLPGDSTDPHFFGRKTPSHDSPDSRRQHESHDPNESAILPMCLPEPTDPTEKESDVLLTFLPESIPPTGKESVVFSMSRPESTYQSGKEPAVSPNPNGRLHESTKLEKESFVLESRNGDDLEMETTQRALRECLPKPTGLEMSSPSLEDEWQLRSQNEKTDLTKSSDRYMELDEMNLLWIEDLDPSLVEHLTTFGSHLSSSLGQSSGDHSSAPDDVYLQGCSIEPDVVSLEVLLPETRHEAPKVSETELSDGSVHMRLTSSTVRVLQAKSFPVIPPKPQFARIPPSTPTILTENGSTLPISFDARCIVKNDVNNSEEESFGFVPDSFEPPATSARFQKQRNSMPGSLETYGSGEAEIRKGNDAELSMEKYNLWAKVYDGEDLHPSKSFMERYGPQRRTSEPSPDPIESQQKADRTTDPSSKPKEGLSSAWKHHGTTDPSQNPIEGHQRVDGTTDPSQNPIEGLSSAWKHHEATDPSPKPIEGQQRVDGTTDPSPKPIEGLSSMSKHHGTMDPCRYPIEGQQRADETMDPSRNLIEGQRRADGSTDPSPKPTEGQQRADGSTDTSQKPREGQWRADGTMDPSPKPTEGQWRADGSTDPSPKPTEGQQRADGTTDASPKPREGQWKADGSTDPSQNPTEGQRRADGTTDPSPKPTKGQRTADGSTDPSPKPIEDQQRAEATPPKRAQWRNQGGSMSFDEAVALAKERQGVQAAMRRMKTSGCGEDGAEKKAATTLQRKPALKLSRPQSCVGLVDGHLGVRLVLPDGQATFDPEGGPPKGRRGSAKGRRLSLSEEVL